MEQGIKKSDIVILSKVKLGSAYPVEWLRHDFKYNVACTFCEDGVVDILDDRYTYKKFGKTGYLFTKDGDDDIYCISGVKATYNEYIKFGGNTKVVTPIICDRQKVDNLACFAEMKDDSIVNREFIKSMINQLNSYTENDISAKIMQTFTDHGESCRREREILENGSEM